MGKLLFTLLLLSVAVFADETIEEICAKTACRSETKLTLNTKEKGSWTGMTEKAPYVFNDMVNIISGEEFWVTYKVSGNKLTELKYSKVKVENALHFSLKQNNVEMELRVEGNLKQDLKFHAAGIRAGRKYLKRIDSCPVIAGKPLVQKIKRPQSQLVLMEFQLLEVGEARKCD